MNTNLNMGMSNDLCRYQPLLTMNSEKPEKKPQKKWTMEVMYSIDMFSELPSLSAVVLELYTYVNGSHYNISYLYESVYVVEDMCELLSINC